jgi:hypothetical protein
MERTERQHQPIRKAEGSASDHSYALQLLEIKTRQTHWISSITLTAGSMMKHCFMPRLTTEEIGGYLMKKSGRWLNDAPDIQLVYAIPQDVYD